MKKGYGFEVSLNGKKIARAGIPKDNYVVNCIVDAVHRKDGSEELYMRYQVKLYPHYKEGFCATY
ncbi:hypothetical protein [Sphingobacterium sp. SGR-19]|uniref:hypothetical protein n=1 Tax=Sphingobacterium sp. SGR-19 TaxID=2710886 RepID=UPI001F0E6A80|nr:hypothetical protein [Sphingobacterium sp. SGR-19]